MKKGKNTKRHKDKKKTYRQKDKMTKQRKDKKTKIKQEFDLL